MKQILETGIIRILAFFFGNLPRRVNLAIGGCMGWLFYFLAYKRRRIALKNLETAFGDEKDPGSRRRIARASFRYMFMNVTEFFLFPSLTREAVSRYVTVQGEEYLIKALDGGKGVLVLSGHFGNWDLLSATLALKGYDLGHVSKIPKSEAVTRIWFGYRRDKGIKIFSGRGIMKESLRHLARNGILGVVTDQNARRKEGVFVPFFGRQACTLTSLAILARRTGLPVLPVYSFRTGMAHNVVIEKPLSYDPLPDRDLDLLARTETYSKCTERIIRLHPEQWIWLHDRWKTRPKGESRVDRV